MADLLFPGAHRAAGLGDDGALVAAMLAVEAAWVRVLVEHGAATPEQAAAVAAVTTLPVDRVASEGAGNPVLPVVQALRRWVPDAAAVVHVGLTSQDVLDTALMLVARDAVAAVRGHLLAAGASLARLADEHRGALMTGRTLTQPAVPVTFGLRAAQWLAGVLDAVEALDALRFPVQCGGAAGTLARASLTVADPVAASTALAHGLGLEPSALPWHTRRAPVTRLGDALALVHDGLGAIANGVLELGRAELGEVREAPATGRGGSSTMPHKQNPVLSVLVSSAALQAPVLAALLHTAAGRTVDERPPGAWHAEWLPLQHLLRSTVVSASQAAELVDGLVVDTDAMARHAEAVASDLLAERGDGPGDPRTYLGATGALIDAALARWKEFDDGA